MQMGKLFLPFVIGSATVVSVHCGNEERTGARPPMPGPESATAGAKETTTNSNRPVPLPANTSPTTSMPETSCGTLLGPSTCDPITAWPCNTEAGETCDYSNSAGAFRCYLLPTAVPLCGFCDQKAQYCAPGSTCVDDLCQRYCCADSDCGQGTCYRTFNELYLAPVGYCGELSIALCGLPDLSTPGNTPQSPISDAAPAEPPAPADAGSGEAATDG
jgi:hypothetical protein